MENAGGIVYTVDIETAKLVGDTKSINRELDNLDKGFKKTDVAAKKASGGMDGFSQKTKSASSDAAGFSAKLTPLAAAIGGLISVQALVNMQRMAEQFTILSARITRLSTDSTEAAKTYRALLNISSQTGANIANTVGLWESLTGTLKEMGRTNSDVLRLTETLQKIGTLGGSSAEDMSNALRQLGQGLAGGVIRAEEFNGVLEGMPELARQIARGLGIPFSELRQRMLDGQLTAEDVLEAIEKRTQKVNEEFSKIPRTVSQATNSIVNEMGAAIAAIDKAAGASSGLAKALDAIAKGIRLTAGNLTDQERLNQLFSERQKIVESLAKSEGTWRENMPGAVALREKLKKLETELLEIQNRRIEEQKKESAPAAASAPDQAAETTTEDGQKALESMRAQLELARLQGEARVRLAAIQKLGAGATNEERAEAEKLAAEIYRLDEAQKKSGAGRERLTEAQKAAKKSAEDLASAQEQDVKAITDMAEALYQASLGATELAQRQAELALSQYATPEQIESVRALAAELQRVRDIEKRKDEFGSTTQEVTAKITGDVDPLSGGAFDNQTARYEAEAAAEDKRYQDQLDRLATAKELQIQVTGGYQALEEQMAQTHADRLVQIEQAKNQVLLSSGQAMFESLASGVSAFAGESSAAYKALFATAKAFAIANASLNLTSAISQAMADPTALTPAQKFANMAAVGAAGANLVSQITSATMSGRAQGGPVQAGQMYRINETGAPEVYNAANGQQYMLPNQRGQVVSNSDASGGSGGITNYISIEVGSGGDTSVSSGNSSSESVALAQSIRAVVVDTLERENRQGGMLWGMRNNG